MNVGLFIAVVIVMMLLVGGVSVYMKLQERRKNQLAANNVDDFATASRSLGVLGLSCTLGLKCLGSGYVLGMPGAGWNYGVGTWWYMAATGAMFVILCAFTGPWVRRFGYTTVNELWGKMFNQKTAVMMSGIAAGTCFGIMTLEIQGVGTIISVLTGWKLAVGCIFAGVVSILYVIFGGMKQIAKLNQINAFIMYAGVLIALFTIGKYLPDGWQGVNEYYLSGDESWKLNIMANAETWRTYIIGMFLAVLFYNTIGPTSLQIISSTKNVNVIRKSIFWMIPMNLMFGACILAFGMAAKSIAEYSAIPGPPIATVTMLMNLLPNWIVVWIFVSFSLAMISTIAMQLLVMPTCFIRDVLAYTKPLKPEKEFSFLRWHSGFHPAALRGQRYRLGIRLDAACFLAVRVRSALEAVQQGRRLVHDHLRHIQHDLVLFQPARPGAPGRQQQLHRPDPGFPDLLHPVHCFGQECQAALQGNVYPR